eukprot:2002024-Pleurochrysis_carterae.AAC.2
MGGQNRIVVIPMARQELPMSLPHTAADIFGRASKKLEGVIYLQDVVLGSCARRHTVLQQFE